MPEPYKKIGICLRRDQVSIIKTLYPEISISTIARVLFDLFLEDPYHESMQDSIGEEYSRSNTAMRKHQFKKKERTENEPRPARNSSLILREQLLRSNRTGL